MNKIVVTTLAFVAGAAAGFAVGYFVATDREREEVKKVYVNDIPQNPVVENPPDPAELESPTEDDPDKLISNGPAHIALPGQKGVNYSKVQQIVKENGYTDPEDIQRVVDDPDNEETYDERIERELYEESRAMEEYRKKNKGKIVPIQSDEWDTDFPEVMYDHKDLHYFTEDDVLTDEDNNVLNEEEYIGSKPRQFGWMANNEVKIYIRNNPKETDFQVWKHQCTREEWWS